MTFPNIKDIKQFSPTSIVAGGAGFIGSNLCEYLLNEGHKVICVDSLFCSTQENINHLFSYDKFSFLLHDIVTPLEAEADFIWNLACPASPDNYQRDPIHTIKTNVIGSMNLLELAKQQNAKIFQSSTSEVYGDPQVTPQPESYYGNVNPNGVRACYDEGKRCAESLFFEYYRQHKVSVKVGRIFNTYGPRMLANDGRVVSNFIMQALTGKNITIYGNGAQTRSFCYIDDLILGITKLMVTEPSVTGPINLGNNQEISVLQLAELIIELTGSSSKIIFLDKKSDDPVRRKPDLTLARNIIGWVPSVPLKSGLLKTIDYYQMILKSAHYNAEYEKTLA